MLYAEVRQALEQEDRTPLAILWMQLILSPFLLLFPLAKNAILAGGEKAEDYATLYEISFMIVLVIALIVLVRSVRFDLRNSKQKRDEREVLHDHVVSRIGYVAAVIGICIYAIPFQIIPAGSVFTGFEVPALLLVILIVRLWKRIRLNREN